MKTKKIIKTIITILLIFIELFSLLFLSHTLLLYKGVETFYRIIGIIILIYLFFFISYLMLRSIKRKGFMSFFLPAIISIILIVVQFTIFYYLHTLYKTIDNYSDNENTYYSVIVSYDKSLKKETDLVNKKIGIVNDTSDIEGYILPNEIINDLKLEKDNTIKKYNSTMELLYAVKNKEIDAAFFSRNYIDMFYNIEGYETIEEDTVVIYEKSKIYVLEEDELASQEESSLTKPFTMLFIGVDSSTDGVTSGYNADVLLLVTFNPTTLRATITSVPRDMYLKTACSGNNYRRINTTTWGSSSSCAVQTIEKLFGVSINYYAKINFKGVVQLVEAVGGIDVDVPYSFCEQNSSRKWGNLTNYVESGKQHLNGEQALALARNRHSAKDSKAMAKYCPQWTSGSRNDYTRGKNQMKVILGIASAATKLKNPNQAIDILKSISSNFQTNIKSKDVISLYNLAKTIAFSNESALVNVQRLQLSGYSTEETVYDISSKSYPSLIIPYNGSINDIKEEMQINLGKKKATPIKTASFDLNHLFKDTVIGTKSYSQAKIAVIKDVSKYSVPSIKSYASQNGLELKFIDVKTNQAISLDNYGTYKFSSQKEVKGTILELVKTLTIYVKKTEVIVTPEEPEVPQEPVEQGD
ncbi:MAG: hypothetical protein GX758_04735 [Tenericutes bacterium]|nr:hypothetical protein [Mycoplasmatota bacterium]